MRGWWVGEGFWGRVSGGEGWVVGKGGELEVGYLLFIITVYGTYQKVPAIGPDKPREPRNI